MRTVAGWLLRRRGGRGRQRTRRRRLRVFFSDGPTKLPSSREGTGGEGTEIARGTHAGATTRYSSAPMGTSFHSAPDAGPVIFHGAAFMSVFRRPPFFAASPCGIKTRRGRRKGSDGSGWTNRSRARRTPRARARAANDAGKKPRGGSEARAHRELLDGTAHRARGERTNGERRYVRSLKGFGELAALRVFDLSY